MSGNGTGSIAGPARTPEYILVEQVTGYPQGAARIIYTDTSDDPDVLVSDVTDEYSAAGWAVREESSEHGIEWGFRVPDAEADFWKPHMAGGPVYRNYSEKEGREIADKIQPDTGKPMPVLCIYEYDPRNLAHAVLLADAVEYTSGGTS